MIIKQALLAVAMLFATLTFSQSFKKEKRIYMLDITKSMWGSDGKEYNIFDDVKSALYKGIEEIQDPGTIVTIIPFQATHTYDILDSWTFEAGNATKFAEAKKTINSYTLKSVPSGYTDIYSALETAKKHTDDDRINYIFLLTDGKQSPKPSSPNKVNRIDFNEADLLSAIGTWCNYSQKKDVHLFYVMLTKIAVDKTIIEIVKKQCNAYAVEGTNINIAFIKPNSNEVRVNLHDNPEKIEIALTANDWNYIDNGVLIDLKLEDNTLFELKDKETGIENNKIIIKLKTKNNTSFENLQKDNPIESEISLVLSTNDDVKILNPNINITVKNKKEKVLTLEFTDDE